MRSRVELFEDIRGDERRQDVSIRELASPPGALADGAAGVGCGGPTAAAAGVLVAAVSGDGSVASPGRRVADRRPGRPSRQPHTARRVRQ